MSRPTPYDFTQPSDFKISKVLNYMIVGLDENGTIHEDITNPDYEAWFMFRLKMVPHATARVRMLYAAIIIVTDGDHWFKIHNLNWPKPINDSCLRQLKLIGIDNAPFPQPNGIYLHPNDKTSINEIIKDLMQKEKYSLQK